ncbi:hypothetical protein AUJ14_01830 [Candidatus Micrarchaeota archaeon CG1_02_55_22]|nr:MAG: hypothetical protein AUJ14_01830 [Candidatus Micrarchaeota archaeon CG1_02_55_22]
MKPHLPLLKRLFVTFAQSSGKVSNHLLAQLVVALLQCPYPVPGNLTQFLETFGPIFIRCYLAVPGPGSHAEPDRSTNRGVRFHRQGIYPTGRGGQSGKARVATDAVVNNVALPARLFNCIAIGRGKGGAGPAVNRNGRGGQRKHGQTKNHR